MLTQFLLKINVRIIFPFFTNIFIYRSIICQKMIFHKRPLWRLFLKSWNQLSLTSKYWIGFVLIHYFKQPRWFWFANSLLINRAIIVKLLFALHICLVIFKMEKLIFNLQNAYHRVCMLVASVIIIHLSSFPLFYCFRMLKVVSEWATTNLYYRIFMRHRNLTVIWVILMITETTVTTKNKSDKRRLQYATILQVIQQVLENL